MGLLTYAYDPVGTANVLVRAMETGQQRSAAQQQMLMELAKSLADSRRHSIEFDRTQSFNQAKEDEERRRWNIENSPIGSVPTSPTASPTATPSSTFNPSNDFPGETSPTDVPPPQVQPSAPGVNLYNTGAPDQSQPLLAAPSFAADLSGEAPLSAPDTTLPPSAPLDLQAAPVNPLAPAQYDVPTDTGETDSPAGQFSDPFAGQMQPLSPQQLAAQAAADNPPLSAAPVGRPPVNPALFTAAGRAATRGNPLDPGALPTDPSASLASPILDPLTDAQNRMAAQGISRKVAAPRLAELSAQLALRNAPAPSKPLPKLPDGSILAQGKQYVLQKDGSYSAAPSSPAEMQSVEEYQKAKGWTKDVDPGSPTFGALVDTDGAAHWVHVGGNGKVVDMPVKPPAQRIGFDEKGKAAELGYVPKDGMWFDPATGIYHRAGENGFLGVNPREVQTPKGAAIVKPTTTEQIWATQHAATVDRMAVVKPLLDKANLPLTATYDDLKKVIVDVPPGENPPPGKMSKPQADYANYWLGKFRAQAGANAKDSGKLGNFFEGENAKLQVLKAKGITVTPIDPTELRNAMLQEGASSPDPNARAAATAALQKQGDTPPPPPAPTATPAPVSPTATPAPAVPGAKTIWKQDANGVKWEYDATTKKPTGLHILPSKAAA